MPAETCFPALRSESNAAKSTGKLPKRTLNPSQSVYPARGTEKLRFWLPGKADFTPIMAMTPLTGWFAALFRCRLCWRVTFAVFAAIFVIEAAILIPSYQTRERALLDRLDQVYRATVVSSASYVLRHDGAEFVYVLDELSQNSKLAGGAIYRADGSLVGSFGEAPVNRPGALSAGGEYLADSNRYEVVWRPDQTGLDVVVVGRLNASGIPAQLRNFVWRIAGLVLLISGFVCVVTMFILDRIVLGPMLTIRDKLVSAQRDPAHADRYTMSAQRNDEVGEVVEALNSLLVRVSKTHREDLAAMVAMADKSNEGIIAYDRIWQVVYANRACFNFCNASGMRQLGEDGLPRFALADTPGTFLLAELIEDGEFSGEATLIGAGGARVPCYVNAGQILDERGKVLRYFATMTDVTQLSNARKNLQRQNLELEASNRVKNEFVANMSHELRTPLNAILGFSEMMMNEVFGPVGTDQYREYLRDINDSGNHLLEIINNILDLSKIEAGRFELRDEEIDAVHAIESSIRLIRERARHRNIEIGTDFPDRLPRMRGDSQKVKQILINLLGNAIKFTPEGGRITVSARTEPDGHLSIAVADNGVGIAEKDKAKVLLPFGQADSGLARRFEGTGLGLPLAKAMMELHSGRLDLDSEIDRGTTVTLRFPSSRVLA